MKYKLWLVLMLFSLTLISCSSDDDPTGNESSQTEETRYYVKYEAYMPLGFSGVSSSRKITYTTEKGEQTISIPTANWEGTYGPLKKNTKVYLKVEAESGGIRTDAEYYVRLSVSRGKEPFVIKGEQRLKETSKLYTEYTIDF